MMEKCMIDGVAVVSRRHSSGSRVQEAPVRRTNKE
jgi:hypothetical protein